ncbi:MAG: hypothetical protein P8Y53_05065 [Pseudolabrys sp.]|jgi:hypothetical protein
MSEVNVPSRKRVLSQGEFDLLFAHRANITNYRRLLLTPLTAQERAFVERRLAEEETALDQII